MPVDSGFINDARNLIRKETDAGKRAKLVNTAYQNIQHAIYPMDVTARDTDGTDVNKEYKALAGFRSELVSEYPGLNLQNTDPIGAVADPGPMIDVNDHINHFSDDPFDSTLAVPQSAAQATSKKSKSTKDEEVDEEVDEKKDSDLIVNQQGMPKQNFDAKPFEDGPETTILGKMFRGLMNLLATLYTFSPAFHDAVVNLAATVTTTVNAAYYGAKGLGMGVLALGTSPLFATNATEGIPTYFANSAAKAFEESAKNDGTIPLVFSFLLDPRSAATKANLKNSLPSKILYALTPDGLNKYFKIDPPSSVYESQAAFFSKAGEQFTEQQALGSYLKEMRNKYAQDNNPATSPAPAPTPTTNNPPASGQQPAAGQQPTTGSTPAASLEDEQHLEVDIGMTDSIKPSAANPDSLLSRIAGSIPFFRTRPTPQVPLNLNGANPPGFPQIPAADKSDKSQPPKSFIEFKMSTKPNNKPKS